MSATKFKLTDRDSAILVDLFKHRYLSVSQIQTLHFPSLQTAYRRMRLLREADLVSTFDVPNIDEAMFFLSSKGHVMVAGILGLDGDDLKTSDTRAKPKDYYFMQHFLAINDFRILLRQACEDSSIRLLGFIPEYYAERTSKGAVTKYVKDVISDISAGNASISHTPDGVFALEREGKNALFFLEIDRGTEVVSDPAKGVLKSIRFYSLYQLDGKFQRYAGDFGVETFKRFRALYVTTVIRRVENIRQAADSLKVPDGAKRLLWITSWDQLNRNTVFDSIWKSADMKDDTKYRIG